MVESQFLYAAPIWLAAALAFARTTGALIQPQRAIALRIVRAYQTVSDEAALLLAYMSPADRKGRG